MIPNQALAVQGASILYDLAKRRALAAETLDWAVYWYRVARFYEYTAAVLVPGLGFTPEPAEPDKTIQGIGVPTVAVRLGTALLAATLSTGCALDMNGLAPADYDAGHRADVATVATVDAVDAGQPPLAAETGVPDLSYLLNSENHQCQKTCNGCCSPDGVCLDNEVASCGTDGTTCVDCRKFGAYCTVDGMCSTADGGHP